jgi:hypothetical protein
MFSACECVVVMVVEGGTNKRRGKEGRRGKQNRARKRERVLATQFRASEPVEGPRSANVDFAAAALLRSRFRCVAGCAVVVVAVTQQEEEEEEKNNNRNRNRTTRSRASYARF